MSEYNYNDINEAKKRVKEMQSRARGVQREEKGESLTSLIYSIENPREIALALFIMYITEHDSISEELLNLVLAILL